MFERFTDRARRAVVLAQDIARSMDHNFISVEHLLLGLLNEDEGVAAEVLKGLGLTFGVAQTYVSETTPASETPPGGHIPFTPWAKDALDKSLREALQLGHSYIGTEHVLLGLIRDERPYSEQIAEVLGELGTDPKAVRRAVIEKLSGYQTLRRTVTVIDTDDATAADPDADPGLDVSEAVFPLHLDAINARLADIYTTTGIVLWWVTPHPDIGRRRPCDVLGDHQDMSILLRSVNPA